ncbi:sodium-dependent multivitamin transporter-like [Amphiura filiformis]|uniref:sodium-dependent multivitamin transporter-like n=1 Tax=Amphiura filiformis TaxID=82378 RepID=UPI003B21B0B7
MANANGTHPLGAADYAVFSVFLGVAAITGIYHGLAKGGQRTISRYLLADRGVFTLPVAMTLLVSFVSPVLLLGVPAEVYVHGGVIINSIFGNFILYPIMAFIFVPVYYDCKLTSAYEYLDRRYNFVLRIIGACIYIFQTCCYMAIVTYAPSLAIEAVTGFAFWKSILITGIVCIFYTAMGGLKAVIWTDVIMFFVMFGTTIMVLIMGSIRAGGFSYVWQFNKEHGRLNLGYCPIDVTERITLPNAIAQSAFVKMSLWAVSQTGVQRFLAAKSKKQAQISALLNLPFFGLIFLLACFEGLVLYAFYHGDISSIYSFPNSTDGPEFDSGSMLEPLRRQPPNYTSPDQILIYFISQEFGNLPGYQGLFIACLFAGSLSTVSSGLNGLSAVTLVDIIRPFRKWRHKDQADIKSQEEYDTRLSKILTFIYGVVGLGLAFLASKLGTLLKMAFSLFGALGGPLIGAFLLGMLWQRTNTRGILMGVIVGALLGLVMCVGNFNHQDNLEDSFGLFQVSFYWYGLFTLLVTTAIAVPASEIIRHFSPAERDKQVDPVLLLSYVRPKQYQTVGKEAERDEMKTNTEEKK